MCKKSSVWLLPTFLWVMIHPVSAQNLIQRADSILKTNYSKARYDTAYVIRPQKKWTITARMNVSGAAIEAEGIDEGLHFKSYMEANTKSTLSLGVGYQGISLSFALNPAKMMGKYQDYEFNLNFYRRNFGFDFIYQDAKNFKGWYDLEGYDRFTMPDGMLKMQTMNINFYYAFNNRRFSYPAAFSQSYIQRRSAGSFLLAASGMGQRATLDWEEGLKLKMANIGIGAGYGYNFVPGRGWLLHISALPTFIVYSNASMTFDDNRTALHYRFPETIITARGAVVRQWSNKFLGLTMVYTYTNIGDKSDLSVYNSKWRIRALFGLRI